jgi:selenocysteine-specific elongation factor
VSRRVVVGTAGHVDHGKTALVRALTGIDTDRLAEEQRRGITIELGFARCDLDGADASIVDVPGHEDFVRTMVAGATGIDVALLVVAADEGVMPQTEEHVAILEFLGVRAGVVALSKVDLAEREWLQLVRADVGERLAASRVRWTEIVGVSSVTGEGVPELRSALAAAAGGVTERRADDLFRLPVDRAFTVAGTGTVITGTAWTGSVRVGDEVAVFPGNLRVRVRAIQTHGEERTTAEPGTRTALALSGLPRDAVARGSVIVAGPGWRETSTLDVEVALLPEVAALRQRSRVRVHLGTNEVLARVTPAGDAVAAGETGDVRLRLERPVLARWGDRVVLRSYSPVTTIGGGTVADPTPALRPRRPPPLGPLLRTPEERLVEAVRRAGAHGLPLSDLPVRLGIPPHDGPALVTALEGHGMQRVGQRLLDDGEVGRAREAILSALAHFHESRPLELGMPREALRREAADPELADTVVDELALAGTVMAEGVTVRLATHDVALDAAAEEIARKVRNVLRNAGSEGMSAAELETAVGHGTRPIVDYLVRVSEAMKVGRDRYLDSEKWGEILREIRAAFAATGELGPAQLRDRLGLTRKYSIPLLEWLDAQGYTTRVGDIRRPGPRLTEGSASS